MAKGMRLDFLGHHVSPDEIGLMASCLGYNAHPQYNGWGSGYERNYLAFDSGKSFDICMNLVKRDLMCCENAKDTGRVYTYFHVTDLGKRILAMFRRCHRRPRLNLWRTKK